jgi:hypothetical protein
MALPLGECLSDGDRLRRTETLFVVVLLALVLSLLAWAPFAP